MGSVNRSTDERSVGAQISLGHVAAAHGLDGNVEFSGRESSAVNHTATYEGDYLIACSYLPLYPVTNPDATKWTTRIRKYLPGSKYQPDDCYVNKTPYVEAWTSAVTG